MSLWRQLAEAPPRSRVGFAAALVAFALLSAAGVARSWLLDRTLPSIVIDPLRVGQRSLDAQEAAQAVPEFAAAAAIERMNGPRQRDLGAALAQAGRLAEATTALERAVRLAPGDADAWANLGIVLLFRNRVPEAIPYLERAVELEPEHAEASRALANARRRADGTAP
ncbi:MAG: tetratricopeptide repeat protein [Myxococcota bacterium]|nr:tetratricopeptide repeat protein [Myxococcota bacterium]